MAVVELIGVTKTYPGGTQPAVQGVDLRIEHGEFMVLLGPSGCGKSTTLRMIAGLESITAGTLCIDDLVINRVPARDRDIAMVFQSYALYPHMSVRDNMAFGLRRRGFSRPDIERRVASVADGLGLGPYLDRRPFALSGGQRQRVALGRAIVREPKVFLFDEPLSNLDAALRTSTRGELARLHQNLGATMIYVTHDQVEAMTLGDRICIMSSGKVVQIGRPMDVYSRPADIFVAGFLGSPPMNLLPATIEVDGGSHAIRLGDQRVPIPATMPASDMRPGPVIFGIRPEDMAVVTADSLEAQVATVAPLGAETILSLALPGVPQEALLRAARDVALRPGDHVRVACDLATASFFDPDTGRALSSRLSVGA